MGYLAQLAWPTISLGWMLSIYQRGKASMKRLDEIFDARRRRQRRGRGAQLEIDGAVEWERRLVQLLRATTATARTRTDSRTRCKNINVKVGAGEKLAIVGRTGSGKSTMVKLLARLIEPTDGRVLLDGRDIRDMPLRALRRTIGMVPQEPTLFSDTLARNIAFGQPDAPIAEIESAARIAGLEPRYRGAAAWARHHRRRARDVALGRAEAARHDRAAAHLRSRGGGARRRALERRYRDREGGAHSLTESVQGRTTIVVAHRASTVRDADQIVVLEEGEIAERGTHEELMAPARNLRRAVPSPIARRGAEPLLKRCISPKKNSWAGLRRQPAEVGVALRAPLPEAVLDLAFLMPLNSVFMLAQP